MNFGQLLILGAVVSGGGATAVLGRDYLADESEYSEYARPLIGATALLLTSALAYLTYQFVTTDYSNAYVWRNTADYLPLLYRVTGVYASNAGSILLWATLAAAVAAFAASVRGVGDRATRLVYLVAMSVVTYFAGMLVLDSPFAPITTAFPDVPPGFTPAAGRGLNPLLVDPYMAIHPPVMFVSYALLTVPFAIGVAHFVSVFRTGEGIYADWIGSVTRWLRVSWLFLTGAVSLGALWSYTVLGWGGIWAWDPVETAILIPWLFLTATLHAVTNYRTGRKYTTLAPAMTAAVFSLAVYTTTIVRSGVFRSVHSFASDGIGTSLLVLMGATALLGVGLPLAYWFLHEGDGDDRAGDDGEWLTRSNLLHLSVLGLGLLAFVSLWGLTFPVLRDATTGIEVSVEPKYYNLWSYPITLGVLLVLGFYMDFDHEGRSRSLFGFGVFATATVLAALYTPSEAWTLAKVTPGDALVYRVVGNASVLSAFPPVAYVGTTVVKRGIDRVRGSENRNFQLKETGITLIHVGVALLVFSLAFTYLFTGQASVIVQGTPEERVDVPNSDYAVRVAGYTQAELPDDGDVTKFARSPQQVLALGSSANNSAQTVYGTVTNVREGSRATVVQLDNSRLWIGVTGDANSLRIQEGQRIVAKGVAMWDYVPQADVILLTDAARVGPVSDPPEAISPTRVQVESASLVVFENGERVVAGEAGQRTYVMKNGMQVRDVLVKRGLFHDTYVIAAINDGTVSLTVKRIPLMTPLRISILLLLAGMGLVLLYDPAHGLWRLRTDAAEPTPDPATSD
jgi:cytochrome c-type biogenesis protein CcmF